MSGMLPNLFDGGGEQSSSQSSHSHEAGVEGGVDLSHSVGVSHDAEVSWEDPDDTTHTYSSDTDIVLTVDASAALGASGSLTEMTAEG